VQQSIELVKALKGADNSAELILKQGADHSWPTIREELEKMALWFDAQLRPPAP
jgi:S-formylglutathione hydrolase FrmB